MDTGQASLTGTLAQVPWAIEFPNKWLRNELGYLLGDHATISGNVTFLGGLICFFSNK